MLNLGKITTHTQVYFRGSVMKNYCKIIVFLACAAALSVSGCGSSSAKKPIILPEYPSSHIDAQCVVTFFAKDSSRYISQQKHIFYPAESAMVITANEPEDYYAWTLEKGDFRALGLGYPPQIPYQICTREISDAISVSMFACGGFLDNVSGLRLEPKNISGQWYQPVQLLNAGLSPVIQTVYRNISSGEFEWVQIKNTENNTAIAARSYNRRVLGDSDITLPTAIDIFNVDKYGRPSDRIVKVDYKSLQLAE